MLHSVAYLREEGGEGGPPQAAQLWGRHFNCINCEWSKLYLSNGYLEKSCISETKHFGHMVLETKSVCFDPISRYME